MKTKTLKNKIQYCLLALAIFSAKEAYSMMAPNIVLRMTLPDIKRTEKYEIIKYLHDLNFNNREEIKKRTIEKKVNLSEDPSAYRVNLFIKDAVRNEGLLLLDITQLKSNNCIYFLLFSMSGKITLLKEKQIKLDFQEREHRILLDLKGEKFKESTFEIITSPILEKEGMEEYL